jgi:hypothetical protein
MADIQMIPPSGKECAALGRPLKIFPYILCRFAVEYSLRLEAIGWV